MVEVHKTEIPDLLLIQPKIYGDARGSFFESYNHKIWSAAGVDFTFVQDNQSQSVAGVIRGLHFQRGKFAQTKLLRVARGRILDVVVDLRPSSPTFKKACTFELDDKKGLQILVPKQVAHGFVVLSNEATIVYKCDSYYNPQYEGGIYPLDPDLNINWQINLDQAILSEKDKKLPSFRKVIDDKLWELP